MKKALIITLSILGFFLITAIALPFFFKDKIADLIDQQLAESVNAQVYYDRDQVSLSFFRSFPSVSLALGDFGIVGNAPFEGDTLASIDELQVDFNLISVLFADQPSLKGIHLNGGELLIKVLEDGRANYDVAISADSVPETETSSELKLGVDLIEVQNLNVVYDDRSLDFFMALAGINAEGSGAFTADVYDLNVQADAGIPSLIYEDTEYLSNKTFRGETVLNIDMPQMKFTFGEGDFFINDFGFGLDGFLAMPGEDIELDLTFAGVDNSFRSVLSLIPGIYTESFASLKTSGEMDFNGFLKGIYNENSFPAFEIGLKVKDGMFQYPDLPKPVKNVNLDLLIKNESNDLNLTAVAIPAFGLEIGSNPISGKLFLQDLYSYTIDAAIKGRLNLEELTSIFPIEGLSLRGNLAVDAEAEGRYDSVANQIPAIRASLALNQGYVKSNDYPAPLEKLEVKASIQNSSGQMKDFAVDVSEFGFELEQEKIAGKLKVSDFEDLNWDGAIQGKVNLEKILAIFPMEGIDLRGVIDAQIQSTGSYAALENQRYEQLNTQGQMNVSGFYLESVDVPQPVTIHTASMDFTRQRINLSKFDAKLGSSDLRASGFISEYFEYLLNEEGVVKGELVLESPSFNTNEWMSASETSEEESAPLTVIELPKNVNFSMRVDATEVLYDNLTLKGVRGNLALREGVLSFSNASMQTLGGQITLNGNYDPREITNPKFKFDLDIADLSIPSAFANFNTIQAFTPIAQNLTGSFSSKLSFSGILGQDMMPVLSSLDGQGLIQIVETALRDSKILEGITSLTKLKETNTLALKNIKIPIAINDGVMDVKPFDVKLWDYQANIQGSAGFDGSINYLVNMQVPASKFGSQANALLSNLIGGNTENTMIPLALNLTGTYKSPKVSLAGSNSLESLLSSALKSQTGAASVQELQKQVTEQFKASGDSMKQELKARAEVVQDSVKKELQKQANESKDKAVEEAKKLLKGFLKPKSNEPVKPDTTKVGN
ncbi:AsmA-like C-terminal region-containing protein [Algoriphagus namhaensis]